MQERNDVFFSPPAAWTIFGENKTYTGGLFQLQAKRYRGCDPGDQVTPPSLPLPSLQSPITARDADNVGPPLTPVDGGLP